MLTDEPKAALGKVSADRPADSQAQRQVDTFVHKAPAAAEAVSGLRRLAPAAYRLIIPEAALIAAEEAVAGNLTLPEITARINAAAPELRPELVGLVARDFSVLRPRADDREPSPSPCESPDRRRPAFRLADDTVVGLSYLDQGGEVLYRHADLHWVKQIADWRSRYSEEKTMALMDEARPADEAGVQTAAEKVAARRARERELFRDIEAFKGYTDSMVVEGSVPGRLRGEVLLLGHPEGAPGVEAGQLDDRDRVSMSFIDGHGMEVKRSLPVATALRVAETYDDLLKEHPPLSEELMEDQVTAMLSSLRKGTADEGSERLNARAFRHFHSGALADEVGPASRKAIRRFRVRQPDPDVYLCARGNSTGKSKGTAAPIGTLPRSEVESIARLMSLCVPEALIEESLLAKGMVSSTEQAAALLSALRSYRLPDRIKTGAVGRPSGSPPQLTPAQARQLLGLLQADAPPAEIAAMFRRWRPGLSREQAMAMAGLPAAFMPPGMGFETPAPGIEFGNDETDMGVPLLRDAVPGGKVSVSGHGEGEVSALFDRLELTRGQLAQLESCIGDKSRVDAAIDEIENGYRKRHEGEGWTDADRTSLARHFATIRLPFPRVVQLRGPGGTVRVVDIPEDVAAFVADMASMAADPRTLARVLIERGMASGQVAAWDIIEGLAAYRRPQTGLKGDAASASSRWAPRRQTAPDVPQDVLRQAASMIAEGKGVSAVGRYLWRFSVPTLSLSEAMKIAQAPEVFMPMPVHDVLSVGQKRLRSLGIGEDDETRLRTVASPRRLLKQFIDVLSEKVRMSSDQRLGLYRHFARRPIPEMAALEGSAAFDRRYQRPVRLLLSEAEVRRLSTVAGDDEGLRIMLDELSSDGSLNDHQREAIHEHFFWHPPPGRGTQPVTPAGMSPEAARDAELEIPEHLADTIRLMTECGAAPSGVVDAVRQAMPSLDDDEAIEIAKAYRVLPEVVTSGAGDAGALLPLKFAKRLKEEAASMLLAGFGQRSVLHRLRQLTPCPRDCSSVKHERDLLSVIELARTEI